MKRNANSSTYHFVSCATNANAMIHSPTTMASARTTYDSPHRRMLPLLSSCSIPNLSAASPMLKVSIGTSRRSVTCIISAIPYSYVVRTSVYRGTSRKTSIFETKLLTEKSAMLPARYRYLPFSFLSFNSTLPFVPCHVRGKEQEQKIDRIVRPYQIDIKE